MKAKVNEFFTIIASIALVAAISYSAIHIYQYIQYYGSLMDIPKDIAVPFMELVLPIFAGITILIIILLISRKDDQGSPEEQSTEAPAAAQHVYALDADAAETESAEEPSGQPEVHISKEEYDFFNAQQVVRQEAEETPEESKEEEPVEAASIDEEQPEKQTAGPVENVVPETDEPMTDEEPQEQAAAEVEPAGEEKKYLDDDFHKRLEEEVNFSNDKNYELTLLLMNIEPKKYSSDFDVFRQSLAEFFSETAFIYEYPYDHTVAVILPFFSYQESQQELIDLYAKIKIDLQSRSTILRAGFSSKFSRNIDSETLLYETEVAFKKAIEEQGFCILGFEPDINKYQQYYSS